MKRLLLLAVSVAALLGTPAVRAQEVVEDPLHGFCSAGCTEATIGGDAVTPITSPTNFGFTASPENSGNLQLKFLLPDSLTLAQVNAFAAGVSVTGASSASLSLFSTTPWTSGFLETDYLGNTLANGAPKNPLDAFLGATQTLAPTADGYFVLTASMGAFDLPNPSGTPPLFSLSPAIFASGGLILGNLFTPDGVISTAQSGALFFNGPNCPGCTPNPQAVPAPIVGAGLPGLIAGAFSLMGLARWRRKRRALA